MALIRLTKGKFAVVDDDDVIELSRFKWFVDRHGYAGRNGPRPKRGTILMHRQLMKFPKGKDIDHINRNTLDNRRCNLRIASRTINLLNSDSYRGKVSGLRGVVWNKDRRKWFAQIWIAGKCKWLGSYDGKREAKNAYERYRQAHGFYRPSAAA